MDALVAGVGTGGTITGVSQWIKPKKDTFEAVAVEPAVSPVLSGGSPAPTKIQGIGAGFVPEVLETGLLDRLAGIEPGTPEHVRLTHEIKRLTLPGEMGDVFKVTALTRSFAHPLTGFATLDHRRRL